MILKSNLRQNYLEKRKAISPSRRSEASSRIMQLFESQGNILSFCSFGTEINLEPLNRLIAKKGRLYLPKVVNQHLAIYQVSDIDRQLTNSYMGPREPNPLFCSKGDLEQIDCILVPGVAFDAQNYRIGYGKGYYDRFLSGVSLVLTVGVGFKEQLCNSDFPKDPWDCPVKQLALV